MQILRARLIRRPGDLITKGKDRQGEYRGFANLNENFVPRSRLLITGLRIKPEESLAVSHSPAKSVIPKRADRGNPRSAA